MSTRSILHQAMLNEWASRFLDQKSSGLSITEWCRQNNLSRHKYFYWKRQLKETVFEQSLPDIIPLEVNPVREDNEGIAPAVPILGCESRTSCTTFTQSSCARILINGISIEIDSSASETFIQSLIKAVRYA